MVVAAENVLVHGLVSLMMMVQITSEKESSFVPSEVCMFSRTQAVASSQRVRIMPICDDREKRM